MRASEKKQHVPGTVILNTTRSSRQVPRCATFEAQRGHLPYRVQFPTTTSHPHLQSTSKSHHPRWKGYKARIAPINFLLSLSLPKPLLYHEVNNNVNLVNT